jgi:hypothetical protein
LGDAELLDALREKESERRRAYADELRLIAEIDARGIPVQRGCHVGVGALLREMFNLNPGDIRRMVTHAEALNGSVSPSGARIEPALPVVADTLAEGAIGPEHVEAIRKAVTKLPGSASREDRVMAEKILCEAATTSEPYLVKRLGEEIERRLDPDGDEPHEKDLLRPKRRLDLRETQDGVSGSFDLDAETGAVLTNLLSPLTEPRTTDDGPDPRSPSERRGDAFAEILTLAAECPDVPAEAGEPVTLMVSVTLEDLKAGIGHGLLDGYWNVSVAEIRRMACDAKVVPVVLGSKGETLDIGRATRVVPRRIRRALIRRDKGCSFPGCGKKAKWCQAHHIREWSRGGPTALDNLTLLCRRHHRVVHHTGWQIRMRQGIPWYIPPSYVDPARTPRRNTLHAMRTSKNPTPTCTA